MKVLQLTIHISKIIYSSHEFSQALIWRAANTVRWYCVV